MRGIDLPGRPITGVGGTCFQQDLARLIFPFPADTQHAVDMLIPAVDNHLPSTKHCTVLKSIWHHGAMVTWWPLVKCHQLQSNIRCLGHLDRTPQESRQIGTICLLCVSRSTNPDVPAGRLAAFDSDENAPDPIEDEQHACFECSGYATAKQMVSIRGGSMLSSDGQALSFSRG